MLVWIICLTKGLLSSYLTWSCIHEPSRSRSSLTTCKWSTGVNLTSIVQPLFLFFCTLLKKDFPKNVFLLLMWIIILDVVVVRLIKYTVRVVVTIWILVSNSPCLAHWWVWVGSINPSCTSVSHISSVLPVVSLAGYQKYSFMEATDHGYLWWLLLLSLLCLLSISLRRRPWLTSSILWRCYLTFLSQCLLRRHLLLALLYFNLVWACKDILMLRSGVWTCSLLKEDLTIILVALLRVHRIRQCLLLLFIKRLILSRTQAMLIG